MKKPNQYLRIDPELGLASREMDDASLQNLNALKEAGLESARQHEGDLREFAKLLIANK